MSAALTTKQFKSWLDVNAGRMAPYIRVPEGDDPKQYLEDVKRAIVMAYDGNVFLQRCTPISMLKAACGLVRYHVELGGSYPEAYIVPYKNEAVGIVGYRGLIKLMREGGTVSEVNVVQVREKDEFVPDTSLLGNSWKHIPARGNRGEITDVYAEFQLTDGRIRRFAMTKEEIDQHGQLTSKTFDLPDSPWKRHWDAMAAKTVIRIPISRGIIPVNFPKGISTEGALSDDAGCDVVIEPEPRVEMFPPEEPKHQPKQTKPPKSAKQEKLPIPFSEDALKADMAMAETVERVDQVVQAYMEDASEDQLSEIHAEAEKRRKELTNA
jgi:recombination protein RecT